MSRYVIIFIISVGIASISQILLKKSTDIHRNNKIQEYLNWYVILAYFLLFVSTLLTMYAYKKVELTTGMVLETLSYIVVPLLSYVYLHEKISRKEMAGICIIVLGILVYSI